MIHAFPLSEIKILEIFNEDDLTAIKEATSDRFEGYEEYLMYNEFWSHR